ncbi:hypothetical protein HFD88_007032 [Aspergillus terreus]|nr:hypothetical protein HFD88_007032 [Aspergillus terreus]
MAATPTKLEGYDKVAALLSSDPGLQYFRRFATLNTKNLLYYQAQIANLEDELNDIIVDDKSLFDRYERKKNYPFSVFHLEKSLRDDDALQWKKFLEIRELLSKYNDALLQQVQLLRLRAPEPAEVAEFRDWLTDKEGGRQFFILQTEKDVWSEGNQHDLIALCRRQDGVDHFTRWIFKQLARFHRRWGYRSEKRHDPEMGTWNYSDQKIKSFTYIFSLFMSGLLPASSILILFFVKDPTDKLIVILVYNVVFPLVIGFLVKAKRTEIFAAATAFAAVQVALVANSDGGCRC